MLDQLLVAEPSVDQHAGSSAYDGRRLPLARHGGD